MGGFETYFCSLVRVKYEYVSEDAEEVFTVYPITEGSMTSIL
jgi:hypothetical protein